MRYHSSRIGTVGIVVAIAVLAAIARPAAAQPAVDQNAGRWFDTYRTSSGIVGTASTNYTHNAAGQYVTLGADPGPGSFLTTPIEPSSSFGWLGARLDYTAAGADDVTVAFVPSAGGADIPLSIGPGGVVDLTGVAASVPSGQLRVSMKRSLVADTPVAPVIHSVEVTWRPKTVVGVSLSAANNGVGCTLANIEYRVRYSVSFVSSEGLIVWVPIPTPSTNRFGAVFTPRISQVSGNGQVLGAGAAPVTIGGVTLSPGATGLVYWNLGNVAAGTTGTLNFSLEPPQGAINGTTYLTAPFAQASNSAAATGASVTTTSTSGARPFIRKTTSGTYRIFGEDRVNAGNTITYNLFMGNFDNNELTRPCAETYYEAVVVDGIADLLADGVPLSAFSAISHGGQLVTTSTSIYGVPVTAPAIVWSFPELDVAERMTLTYRVDLPQSLALDTRLDNTVTLRSGFDDQQASSFHRTVIGIPSSPSGSWGTGDSIDGRTEIRAGVNDNADRYIGYAAPAEFVLYGQNIGASALVDTRFIARVPDNADFRYAIASDASMVVYYNATDTGDPNVPPDYDPATGARGATWTTSAGATVKWVMFVVPKLASIYFPEANGAPWAASGRIAITSKPPADPSACGGDTINLVGRYYLYSVEAPFSDTPDPSLFGSGSGGLMLTDSEPIEVVSITPDLRYADIFPSVSTLYGTGDVTFSAVARNAAPYGQQVDTARNTVARITIPVVSVNGVSRPLSVVSINEGQALGVSYETNAAGAITRLVFELGDIPPNGAKSFGVTVRVPQGLTDLTSPRADVSVTGNDDFCGPESGGSSRAFTVRVSPYLQARKDVDVSVVRAPTAGDPSSVGMLTYTLDYFNLGDAPSTDTWLVDVVRPETTFVRADALPAGGKVWFAAANAALPPDLRSGFDFTGDVIRQRFVQGVQQGDGSWTSPLGAATLYVAFALDDATLSPAQVPTNTARSLRYHVRVKQGVEAGKLIPNEAAILSKELLQAVSNRVGTLVAPDPSLRVTQTCPAVVGAGETFSYTIDYLNDSSNPDEIVVLMQTLPTLDSGAVLLTESAHTWNQAASVAGHAGDVQPTGPTAVPGGNEYVWDVTAATANDPDPDIGSLQGGRITVTVAVPDGAPSGAIIDITGLATAQNSLQGAQPFAIGTGCSVLVANPDLTIDVLVNRTRVVSGQELRYTLVVDNVGKRGAPDSTLVNELPPGVSFVPNSAIVTTAGWTIGQPTVSGQTLTWAGETMLQRLPDARGFLPATSGPIVIQIRAIVQPGVAPDTLLENCATVDWPGDDEPGGLPDTDCAESRTPFPDPFVTKTGPATALPGAVIGYTIEYGNLSPQAMSAPMAIVDRLWDGTGDGAVDVTLVSAFANRGEQILYASESLAAADPPLDPASPSGAWADDPADLDGPVTHVAIVVPALPGNAGPHAVTLAVRLRSPGGLEPTPASVIDNCVAVTHLEADDEDDSDASNKACWSTRTPGVDVAVSKRCEPSGGVPGARRGEVVSFTLTVRNNGSTDLFGVRVRDVLPDGLTYVDDTSAVAAVFDASGGASQVIDPTGLGIAQEVGWVRDAGTGTWYLGSRSAVSPIYYRKVGLEPGASTSFVIRASVDDDVADNQRVVNTATAATDYRFDFDPTTAPPAQLEQLLGNNSGSCDFQVYVPDPKVDKSVDLLREDGGAARAGDTLVYTVGFDNGGSAAAPGTVLSDSLPFGTTFVLGSLAGVPPGATVTYYDGQGQPYVPTGADGTPDPNVRAFDIEIGALGAPPNATFSATLASQFALGTRIGTTLYGDAVGTLPSNRADQVVSIGPSAGSYLSPVIPTDGSSVDEWQYVRATTTDTSITFALLDGDTGAVVASGLRADESGRIMIGDLVSASEHPRLRVRADFSPVAGGGPGGACVANDPVVVPLDSAYPEPMSARVAVISPSGNRMAGFLERGGAAHGIIWERSGATWDYVVLGPVAELSNYYNRSGDSQYGESGYGLYGYNYAFPDFEAPRFIDEDTVAFVANEAQHRNPSEVYRRGATGWDATRLYAAAEDGTPGEVGGLGKPVTVRGWGAAPDGGLLGAGMVFETPGQVWRELEDSLGQSYRFDYPWQATPYESGTYSAAGVYAAGGTWRSEVLATPAGASSCYATHALPDGGIIGTCWIERVERPFHWPWVGPQGDALWAAPVLMPTPAVTHARFFGVSAAGTVLGRASLRGNEPHALLQWRWVDGAWDVTAIGLGTSGSNMLSRSLGGDFFLVESNQLVALIAPGVDDPTTFVVWSMDCESGSTDARGLAARAPDGTFGGQRAGARAAIWRPAGDRECLEPEELDGGLTLSAIVSMGDGVAYGWGGDGATGTYEGRLWVEGGDDWQAFELGSRWSSRYGFTSSDNYDESEWPRVDRFPIHGDAAIATGVLRDPEPKEGANNDGDNGNWSWRAVVWDAADVSGGMVAEVTLPVPGEHRAIASGVSPDGSKVVGSCWNFKRDAFDVCVWTKGAAGWERQVLPNVPQEGGVTFDVGLAICDDGTVLGWHDDDWDFRVWDVDESGAYHRDNITSGLGTGPAEMDAIVDARCLRDGMFGLQTADDWQWPHDAEGVIAPQSAHRTYWTVVTRNLETGDWEILAESEATVINSRGDVLFGRGAFVARRDEAEYAFFDLPHAASDMNDAGVIVGDGPSVMLPSSDPGQGWLEVFLDLPSGGVAVAVDNAGRGLGWLEGEDDNTTIVLEPDGSGGYGWTALPEPPSNDANPHRSLALFHAGYVIGTSSEGPVLWTEEGGEWGYRVLAGTTPEGPPPEVHFATGGWLIGVEAYTADDGSTKQRLVAWSPAPSHTPVDITPEGYDDARLYQTLRYDSTGQFTAYMKLFRGEEEGEAPRDGKTDPAFWFWLDASGAWRSERIELGRRRGQNNLRPVTGTGMVLSYGTGRDPRAGVMETGCIPSPGGALLEDWQVVYRSNGRPAIDFQVTVDKVCQPRITNTATISTSASQIDGGNDQASATIPVETADVVAALTVNRAVAAFGEELDYTLTITNNGPGPARGVVAEFAPPEGTDGSGDVVSIPLLAAGESVVRTYSATVTVNTSGDPLVAGVSITSQDGIDCDDGNDSASATTLSGSFPNVRVAMTGPTIVKLGDLINWTITTTNDGNAPATAVLTTDSAPVGLALDPVGQPLVWSPGDTPGTLAPGEPDVSALSFRATSCDQVGKTYTNRVGVTAAADTNAADNAASASVTITGPDARLALLVGPDVSQVASGGRVTWTIWYRNTGTAAVAAPQIVATLPAGATTIASTISGGGAAGAGTVSWTLPALAPLGSGAVSFSADVTAVPGASLALGASAVGGAGAGGATTACPVAATSASVVVGSPLVRVAKEARTAVACGQAPVEWVITVTNPGAADLDGLSLVDTPSLPYLGGSIHGRGASAAGLPTLAWNIGTLRAGEALVLGYSTSAPTTSGDVVQNTATVRRLGSPIAETAPAVVRVDCAALRLVKTWTGACLSPGDTIDVEIDYTNAGAAVTGATIADPIAAGLVDVQVVGGAVVDGVVRWDLGALAAGASGTVGYTATVGDIGSGALVLGHATMTAAGVQPTVSNVAQAATVGCDDGDECTVDFCNAGTGCGHVVEDPTCYDVPCVEGDPCESFDLCAPGVCGAAGECIPQPIDCDDDDHCTMDSCFLGECVHTPDTSPKTERCNGVDDTCDGVVDEGFGVLTDEGGPVACTVGVGACVATGVVVCVDEETSGCGAVAGEPSPEICGNDIDDDCNEQVDDGFPLLGMECDADPGDDDECIDDHYVCAGTGVVCQRVNGPLVELCNGVDDNCNGDVDETFPLLGAMCDGDNDADRCRRGTLICNGTFDGLVCFEEDLGVVEMCNGVDDTCDCEGVEGECTPQIDEGFGVGASCTTDALGVCRVPGLVACDDEDASVTVCEAIDPVAPSDESCNGLDDDCDGLDDDDDEGGSVCGPLDTAAVCPAPLVSATGVTITFSNPIAGGAATFECRLDDGAWADCESPFTASALADGQHVFHVRSYDGAGHVDPTPATCIWSIDSAPPDTTIPVHPEAVTIATTATLGFGSDESPVTYRCVLDPATTPPPSSAYAPCDPVETYTGLADGPHTIWVYATDETGNADPTPASYTWTVDSTTPDTIIVTGPADPSPDEADSVFTYAEPTDPEHVDFECRLDGGAWVACDGKTTTYEDLAIGDHVFEVRACVPATGVCDETPAQWQWEIVDFICEEPLTLECSESVTVDAPAEACEWQGVVTATAVDDCQVELTVTSDRDRYPVGTSVADFVATDADGNTETCQTDVIVRDVTAPVVTCSDAADTIPLSVRASATDACTATLVIEDLACESVVDGAGTPVPIASCPVRIVDDTVVIEGRLAEGTLRVTWSAVAADPSGNEGTVTCEASFAPDLDGDGVVDADDNCVASANAEQLDGDDDGVGDACDVCPLVADEAQADRDDDGVGDACSDKDGDGVLDVDDNCELEPNADQADLDEDLIGDVCDDSPHDRLTAEGSGGCASATTGLVAGLAGLLALALLRRRRRA